MTGRVRGEHDRHVRLDGFAGVVIDLAGLQVVVGHAETALTHVNRTKHRLSREWWVSAGARTMYGYAPRDRHAECVHAEWIRTRIVGSRTSLAGMPPG